MDGERSDWQTEMEGRYSGVENGSVDGASSPGASGVAWNSGRHGQAQAEAPSVEPNSHRGHLKKALLS